VNNGDLALTVTGLVSGYVDEPVLRGASLEVPQGEIVTVIGPNGSGKSTLLKTIFGLVRAREGQVVYRNPAGQSTNLVGLKPHQIAKLGVAFVPQLANVFADMSIRENLEIGAFPKKGGYQERLSAVLALFPLLQRRLSERAGAMSGGQRQMLALARALMGDPQMLILDEPSAGLAPTVVDEVFDQVRTINEGGVTVLIVEQKARQCLAFSSHGYVLDMGRNRFSGTGEELLHDSQIVDLYLGGRGRLRAAQEQSVGVPE
jgi:ABC-type branched-subunit amino acid transport system ATPase component